MEKPPEPPSRHPKVKKGFACPHIDVKQIKWSEAEYSLREFVENYRSNVPMFVIVSQGYCAYGEIYTYGSQEVIRVSHIGFQTRLLTRDSRGNHFSIPVNYEKKFHLLTEEQWGTPKSLRDIYEINPKLIGSCIMSQNDRRLSFWMGADSQNTLKVGAMEVIDIYDDQYIVGNLVSNGYICSKPLYIPLFVDIHLSVSQGFLPDVEEEYSMFLARCERFTGTLTYTEITGNPDIILFDEKHVADTSDYMYIEPKSWLATEPKTPDKTSVPDLGYLQPPTDKRQSFAGEEHYQEIDVKKQSVMKPLPRKQSTDLIANKVQTVSSKKEKLAPDNVYQPHTPGVYNTSSDATNAKNNYKLPPTLSPQQPPPTNQKSTTITGDLVINQSVVVGAGNAVETNSSIPAPKIPPHASKKPPKPTPVGKQKKNPPPTADKSGPSTPQDEETDGKNESVDGVKNAIKKPIGENRGDKVAKDEPERKDRDVSVINNVSDIPEDLTNLSMANISKCLQLIHMDKHVDTFMSHDINGALLSALDKDILVNEFHFSSFEANKFLKFRDGWRPKE